MKYQKSVIELIRERKSERTFDGLNIDIVTLEKLKEFLSKINDEAKIKVRFIFTSANNNESGRPIKLGTYGVISGANSYIIGILENKDEDALEFGYLFEKIILFATDLGLGTCWLGGTFKKSDFEENINISENEHIPIVSPVGFKKDKTRLLDSAMRSMAGSDKRKPWNEIFFQDNISNPLTEEKAGPYAVPLEMVRLGPSASNKQPWRIIMTENNFHFYLCRNKGYGVKDYDLQKNDLGIAKCHFELAATELGLQGKWEKLDNPSLSSEWEYIATWSKEKSI